MDTQFWHERWESLDIGFHQADVNPFLVKHLKQLDLAKDSRLFLPLCGKTLDIAWLLSQGYCVAGIELSPIAVGQLFSDLALKPEIESQGNLRRYRAPGIEIFVGDLFELTRDSLGPVQAVYDRAALVALPENTRQRYAAHLKEITDTAPQLLVCYQYDQSKMDGPPFSVEDEEVRRHYRSHYTLERLERVDLPDGLKGKCAATESVWLLGTAKSDSSG